MDPDNQALIKRIVDEIGSDDLVVMLGAADAEALEVAAGIGYPVIVRPSFVIGGLAVDFAYGPEDLAAIIARAVAVDDEAFVQGLAASGMPEPAARSIATFGRAIREGYISEAPGEVEKRTGRPPRSLREVFEANRGDLMQGVSA